VTASLSRGRGGGGNGGDHDRRGHPRPARRLVVALRLKGETVDEIVGMARVMRPSPARPLRGPSLLDTCGTGGARQRLVQRLEAAAFVAAGAGAIVAKHGKSRHDQPVRLRRRPRGPGREDRLSPGGGGLLPAEAGVGFMFAPAFHPRCASPPPAAGDRRPDGVQCPRPAHQPRRRSSPGAGVASAALAERWRRCWSVWAAATPWCAREDGDWTR